MDNLNIHVPASLYKAFPAAEAKQPAKRLEIHYTSKHGSWLDIVEIELNVMTRQCLSRRVLNIEILRKELSAWETSKNQDVNTVKWHFTIGNTREKLLSLYLKFS